jgi:hypothetical protein
VDAVGIDDQADICLFAPYLPSCGGVVTVLSWHLARNRTSLREHVGLSPAMEIAF